MAGETAGRGIDEIRPTYFGASWDAYRAGREGEEDIARRQRQRLCDLVAYARTYSPYYQQLYRHVPEPVSNISQLPAVTKAELMSQFDGWVTDPAVARASVEAFLSDPGNIGRDYLERYVVCTTSGVTGIPAILLHDHPALIVYNVLGYIRSLPVVFLSPRRMWALLRGRGRLAAVFVTGGHYLGNTMMARRIRTMPWRAERSASSPPWHRWGNWWPTSTPFSRSCSVDIPARWKRWRVSSKPAGCTSTRC